MAILALIITLYYFLDIFAKYCVKLDVDNFVLTHNIPLLISNKKPHLQKKILELTRINELISFKYSVKRPLLLLSNTGRDRCLSVNSQGVNYIIFDKNTLENLSEKALLSIFFHEFCHLKSKHELKEIILKSLLYFLGLVLLTQSFSLFNIAWNFPSLKQSLWDTVKLMAILPCFLLFYPKIVLGLINRLSRYSEIQCDLFAAANVPYRAFFEQAHYFSYHYSLPPTNTFQQKIKAIVYNTHPSWEKRKNAVRKLRDNAKKKSESLFPKGN